MTTKGELIEKMARAIDPVAWSATTWSSREATHERKCSLWEATAALAAIEAAGLAVVPAEATDSMVMRALESSVAIMDEAGLDRLSPSEEGPRPSIVTRSAYRAMVEHGRVK